MVDGSDDNEERGGYGGHHLYKYIERNTDDVFTGIAYRVARNGGFMSRGAFAVAFDISALYILFRLFGQKPHLCGE